LISYDTKRDFILDGWKSKKLMPLFICRKRYFWPSKIKLVQGRFPKRSFLLALLLVENTSQHQFENLWKVLKLFMAFWFIQSSRSSKVSSCLILKTILSASTTTLGFDRNWNHIWFWMCYCSLTIYNTWCFS